MKNPEIDIYKALRKNQLITFSSVFICALTICICVIYSYRFSTDMMNLTINKMFTIDTKGEVIPLTLVERESKLKIEIADHIEKWTSRFYTFSFSNVRTQPLRAQWLMAEKDFSDVRKKYDSWYKEVEGRKLNQTTTLIYDSLKIDDTKEPYAFSAPATVIISDGYTENKYYLQTSGKIILVKPDFPKNPHGFLIIDYKENLQKLEE